MNFIKINIKYKNFIWVGNKIEKYGLKIMNIVNKFILILIIKKNFYLIIINLYYNNKIMMYIYINLKIKNYF